MTHEKIRRGRTTEGGGNTVTEKVRVSRIRQKTSYLKHKKAITPRVWR